MPRFPNSGASDFTSEIIAPFERRVVRMKRLAALARRARYQHDTTVVGHSADHRPRRAEYRIHVLGHRAAPLLVGHVGECDVVGRPDAGIADEEIESAQRGRRAVDQLVGAGARRNVRRSAQRPSRRNARGDPRPARRRLRDDCDSRSRRQRRFPRTAPRLPRRCRAIHRSPTPACREGRS